MGGHLLHVMPIPFSGQIELNTPWLIIWNKGQIITNNLTFTPDCQVNNAGMPT